MVISETRWAIYVVYHHHSLCSSGGMAALFQKMFPGSQVSHEFSISLAKLLYMINLDLAPYFISEILNELSPRCPRLPVKFVPAFDESRNRVSTTNQMDVHIIYFDETSNSIKRIYLNSQFMRHATVSDMKRAHYGHDIIKNLVDGPNVNWVFLEEMEKYQKLENPKCPL